MGLSGSGKSTLVRCLTRLIEPTSGVDQHLRPGRARRRRRRRCARSAARRCRWCSSTSGCSRTGTVLDNVAYGLEVQGIDKATRHERARELLGVVGLAPVERSYPDQLSGGMQQRVGLARALAVDPEVLIFDEAFSALDPLIRREMQDEVAAPAGAVAEDGHLRHARPRRGAEARRPDRDHEGRAASSRSASPAEIVGAPADDYVREFVRDVPRGQGAHRRLRDPAARGRRDARGASSSHDQRLGELLPVIFGAHGPDRRRRRQRRARRDPRPPHGRSTCSPAATSRPSRRSPLDAARPGRPSSPRCPLRPRRRRRPAPRRAGRGASSTAPALGPTLRRRCALPLAAAAAICVVGDRSERLPQRLPGELGAGAASRTGSTASTTGSRQPDSSNFFLHTIVGGFGNFLNGATNDVVNAPPLDDLARRARSSPRSSPGSSARGAPHSSRR